MIKVFVNTLEFYKKNLRSISKHLIVSSMSATIEVTLFLLLFTSLQSTLFISHFFSFTIASLIGFLGHSYFTFKVGYLNSKNLIYFIMQATISLLLGYLLLLFFIDNLSLNALIAKIIQLCLVFNFNFIFGKYISFKKR